MNKKLNIITDAIDDIKGQAIITLDVRAQTSEMDYIVIATGTSSQHINSIANNVRQELKLAQFDVRPIEGAGTPWQLVDGFDVVVHIMSDEARQFYELEKLWGMKTPSHAS